MPDFEYIWSQVMERLQFRLPPDEFRVWFSQTALKRVEADCAVVSVPNRFHALWMSEKYLPDIEQCLAQIVKSSQSVTFSYERAVGSDEAADIALESSGLDPSLTFDKLLIGEWNRFACSSARRAADQGASSYNPLYIFSKSALGKTHLLQAIGNRILTTTPGNAIRYIPCETFNTEFSRCSSNDQQQSFEEIHSLLDVLLFDDIHLLQGRLEPQNGLVLIFDSLYARKRMIVVTGDRPVQELSAISQPLRSRLGWGVHAEICMPGQDTLLEIIQTKARDYRVRLPDDVVFFLSHASKDLKALDRNILRLRSCASRKSGQINISLAMSLIKGSDQTTVGIENIKSVTAEYFNIPVNALTSSGKKRSHSYPRQVAMYLARKHTGLSFEEIGTSFGHKDHSTVIYAIRKIQGQRDRAPSGADDVTRIENLLS